MNSSQNPKFLSKGYWGKLFKSKTDKALDTLGIHEHQFVVAQRVKTRKDREEYALDVLRLDADSAREARRIKRLGAEQYALLTLGFDEKTFNEFKTFKSQSRVQKILSLVNDDVSIRGFFNKSYTTYELFKKKHKASWKREPTVNHLNEIQKIVNTAINTGVFTWKDAQQIAMYAYFAIYTQCHKPKEREQQVA